MDGSRGLESVTTARHLEFEHRRARLAGTRIILWFQLFVVVATVFWYLFSRPRTYASTAKLFLQRGRESVGSDPTANATGQTIALQQAGREAEIKSAIDVLKSRGLIEPIVDKLTPVVRRKSPLRTRRKTPSPVP